MWKESSLRTKKEPGNNTLADTRRCKEKIRILGISEGTRDRTNDIKRPFADVQAEKFLNMRKDPDIQLIKAHRISNSHNQNKSIPRHIVIKISDIQERI